LFLPKGGTLRFDWRTDGAKELLIVIPGEEVEEYQLKDQGGWLMGGIKSVGKGGWGGGRKEETIQTSRAHVKSAREQIDFMKKDQDGTVKTRLEEGKS